MGYLTSLYSLFPCLGSKEQCDEDMGRGIIREVMFQHLRATGLELFDEVAEELFYFDDVMLRNISCAFERGLKATDSDSRSTDEMKKEWKRSNENLLSRYLFYWKELSTEYMKQIGHYPLDAFNGPLYYNIDRALSLVNQTEYESKLGMSDYERAFISIEYNEKLFKKRALAILRSDNDEMTRLEDLDAFVQELFSDYLSRFTKDKGNILNAGLAWLHYTKHTIDEVLMSIERWRLEKAKVHFDSLFKEMRNNLIKDSETRVRPRKKYVFHQLTDSDLSRVYKWLMGRSKRVPADSMFDEITFLDAVHYGDYSRVFLDGFKVKLKYTNMILKDYAEKGWIESVASSVNKRVQDIDGSRGYNLEGYEEEFPLKKTGKQKNSSTPI